MWIPTDFGEVRGDSFCRRGGSGSPERKQERNAGSHEGEADDGATGGFPSGY